MSRDTIRKRAQKRDHALVGGGFDPKVEDYFKNQFDSSGEDRLAKEERVRDFLRQNLPLMSDFEEFWRARKAMLRRYRISEQIFNEVWTQFLFCCEKGKKF